MKPTPRVEVDIRGTRVGFLRRDIRQISDAERAHVEQLVDTLHRDTDDGETVTRLVIETDYPDPDRLSYVASYRVEINGEERDGGQGPLAAASECAGGGDSPGG